MIARAGTVHWYTKQFLIPTWVVVTQQALFEGLRRVLERDHETRESIFVFPCLRMSRAPLFPADPSPVGMIAMVKIRLWIHCLESELGSDKRGLNVK